MNLKQWFIDNSRFDLIDRWDTELNHITLDNVSITDKKKYYFKCPCKKHESQLFHINYFHLGRNKNLQCYKCNSFAQHIIDEFGEDYLNKIWNKDNIRSPWEYGYQSKQKVIFNCINCNRTYLQSCDAKSQGQNCPYCSNRKLIKENSLGSKISNIEFIWSDKNESSPYEYSPHSGKMVWWKCENNIHEDYKRTIANSFNKNFTCPKCAIENNKRGFIDLTNMQFGEYKVLKYDEDNAKHGYWLCQCSCGIIKSVNSSHLKDGSIKSCGGGIHKSKENSPTWKGGITSELILARNNSQYDKWRLDVYSKDYYTCQCCGKSKDIVKNAHHFYNFVDNISDRYNIDNGITLCEECHAFKFSGSFHNIYGTKNNTPEQLEEYINKRRKEIGIDELFTVKSYKSGNILKPNSIQNAI